MPYGLVQLSGPAVEPVSLADLKSHRRIGHALDDDLLAALIKAARQYVETATQRALVTQTWQLLLDEFPGVDDGIILPKPRLQAVTAVTYVDGNGDTQTLAASKYSVDTRRDPGWLVPAYAEEWPETREQINAVTVSFRAGYGDAAADVPEGLRQAILLLAGHWYEHREAVAAGALAQVPLAVDSLIGTHWTGEYS